MKRVLILTSVKTGSGHKSSANAIEKKLRDAGYECRQVDVFPLMGKLGDFMEEIYVPLTTRAPYAYYLSERFSQYAPDVIHRSMYRNVKAELLKIIREYRPDLIISVQCMFTKAISRLLRREKLGIPFYIGVIDLVDPPRVWEDPDADMTFVPTDTVRDDYLRKGFRSDRVLVSGFPVRDDIEDRAVPKRPGDPLQIMMMNPSTDLEKNIGFIKEVSRLENVRIRMICGLDERLHDTLLKMQAARELPQELDIYGFVKNVNWHLGECQLLLTKAGPNALIEAVRSGTAVVVTGHIHGQENRNHEFILDNGYGIRCEDPERIYEELNEMIHSGKLEQCLENTITRKIGNGAEVIAEYVRDHI